MKTNKESVQSAKRGLLEMIWSTYPTIHRFCEMEEELLCTALFKVLDENNGTKEQYSEFIALGYMVKGISSNHQYELSDKDKKCLEEEA